MMIIALTAILSTLTSGIVLAWAYQNSLRTGSRNDVDKTIAEAVREK